MRSVKLSKRTKDLQFLSLTLVGIFNDIPLYNKLKVFGNVIKIISAMIVAKPNMVITPELVQNYRISVQSIYGRSFPYIREVCYCCESAATATRDPRGNPAMC